MNYLSIINAFWDSATTNPLSTGQVSLYMALLHVCNRSNWTEWFQAPNQVLSVLTGLSRSGILKARNELKQRGVIDFKERGTKATIYRVIEENTQNSVQGQSTIANSTQVGVQNGVRKGVQNSTRKGVQNGSTLYKQNINETKQEEIPPISPVERLEDFLSAYPKNSNRFLTEREYVSLLLTGNVKEDELVQCARNYAETCKIEGTPDKYIKNSENFLKDLTFEKYLPGKYKAPLEVKQKNCFHNFNPVGYDYDRIMEELNGGGEDDAEKRGPAEN